MIARLPIRAAEGGNYFASPKSNIAFVSTGCRLLDLALGGGWAEGRISNIVGDKSTGKTLLCIEAAVNFAIKYPKAKVRYRECEAAFDKPYAAALGMPLNRIDFGGGLETVEDFFEDLQAVIKGAKAQELYIVDSLDALSDRSEMGRDMDAGTYGTNKARNLSQLFRRLTRQMSSSRVTLIIVSQVRSKIGISFGRSTTRSGGRALDFYASQVLYLSHIATLTKTIDNCKRPVGIEIRAKVDKNKLALPFREAEFKIMFGYGIDDVAASIEWLKSIREPGTPDLRAFKKSLADVVPTEASKVIADLQDQVVRRWYALENSFLPVQRKYGG